MDIEKANTQLDKADTFLEKLKNILKKHWGIILIILGGYFVYWALTTDLEPEVEEDKIEVVEPVKSDEPEYVITKKTFFIDDFGYRKGDTVFVDYYSDGYVEKYYTDDETFVDK